ncbi:MAG: aminotransferase class V-fold PLP-dependent enzyme [Cytophagales bacterium]|nr:aminotransferase class V-fold PLP-dependent enzyme [Cytophagales bacterium]
MPVGKIYLNTGSLGPSPRAVVDAVTSAMHKLESDPASENWGKLGDQIDIVRQKVADFIHADLEEIILTRNTTEGLGLISQSLPLNAGDEIITTTLEHGGGEVGLEFLQKTKGAVLKKVALPLPPERATEIVSVIEKAITPKTRLVMVSHVNTVTGVLMPLAEISRLTSVRGIYLVADGAQAPGQVPVDVKALGVDAYACSGHKWLLGPKETGFLYLRRGFQPSAQPVFTASGYEGYSKSSGTRNVATIIGLGAALDWLSAIGMDRIREHSLKVRTHCMAGLKSVKGIEVISPENPSLATGMVSFSLANVKNSTVHSLLKDQNIIIKVLPQHNAIRISCHVFVSEKDIDTFLTALKKCVA